MERQLFGSVTGLSKWQPSVPLPQPYWKKMSFPNFPNNECLKQAQPVVLKSHIAYMGLVVLNTSCIVYAAELNES